MMGSRRRDLAALAPPLPAAAAAALLHGLAAGHGAGSGGGLAGLAGGSAGKAVASSALAKGLTAVAVVATVGAGTAGITGRLPTVHGDRTPAAAPAQGSAPVAPSTRSAGLPAATGSDSRAREHSKRRGPHRGAAQRHGGGKPSQVRDPHAARQHVKRPAKARPPSPGASAGRPGGRPVKRPRSGSDRAAPGRENHVPRKPDITAPVPPEPPELPLQAPTTEP
jgi:hypothetical protein